MCHQTQNMGPFPLYYTEFFKRPKSKYHLFYLFIFSMYGLIISCMYVCTPSVMFGTCSGQRKILDLPEFVLQKVVSHHVAAESLIPVLYKNSLCSQPVSHFSYHRINIILQIQFHVKKIIFNYEMSNLSKTDKSASRITEYRSQIQFTGKCRSRRKAKTGKILKYTKSENFSPRKLCYFRKSNFFPKYSYRKTISSR